MPALSDSIDEDGPLIHVALGPTMLLAVVFGVLAGYAGLLISYFANLPSGPAIVVIGAAIYGLSLMAGSHASRSAGN